MAGLVGLALLSPLAQAKRAAPKSPPFKSVTVELPVDDRTFPAGPGEPAVDANCLACHSVDMVLNQPALPKATWLAEVNKMRKVYKAPIPDEDVETIANYLATVVGVNQPKWR